MIKVDKQWGYELWIDNRPEYCGKILHFEKGKFCSFHYHKLKTETFYSMGKILLKYSMEDDIEKASEIILEKGMSFHIPVGMRHQMIALEETDLIEVSTQHFDSDSYRIIKGD